MSDDPLPPVVTEITDAPPRRGRRLAVMPHVAAKDRELIHQWMRSYMEEVTRDYEERINLIRSVPDHPSPLYAKLVRNHASMGVSRKDIGLLLGISVNLLDRHYRDDFDLGIAQINLKIASNIARKALSDDPDAAKIGLDWMDRRGGDQWRKSTQKIEVTDDRPPLIDASRLTAEEREQLRAMLTRIADEGAEPLQTEETNGA